MATFIITYDIKEGHEYDSLINKLEEIGAKKFQASVWLLRTNANENVIYDKLLLCIDNTSNNKDYLFVARITGNVKWNAAKKPGADILNIQNSNIL
jgi:CRISPR/Cas system-associated endoribonuclease Cas2